MSAQASLGPLAVSALALLTERPMHPYEMYQLMLKRQHDRIVKVRPGTLYHTVTKLAERGFIEAVGTEREGGRPERTSYEITPDGLQALENSVTELLETPVDEYPVFAQAIGEAHNLQRSTVILLLNRRLEHLRIARSTITDRLEEAEKFNVPRRYLLSAEYLLSHLEADIHFVDKTLSELMSGELDWEGEFVPIDHLRGYPLHLGVLPPDGTMPLPKSTSSVTKATSRAGEQTVRQAAEPGPRQSARQAASHLAEQDIPQPAGQIENKPLQRSKPH